MGEIRCRFQPRHEVPAPLYVAWLESDEHYYVLSDTNPDLEDGPYSSRWQARCRALAITEARPHD